MPHTRMDTALSQAARETSETFAFVLNQADFAAFRGSPHPEKRKTPFYGKLPAGARSPAEWTYRFHPVTEAGDPTSTSRLHVLRADGAVSNVFQFLRKRALELGPL